MRSTSQRRGAGDYLFGRGPAWFALLMTLGLMVFDYIDRQVIVSLFPYLKAAWGPSDTQLGALVSVVSVTVALGAGTGGAVRRSSKPGEEHRRDGGDLEPRDDLVHVHAQLQPITGRALDRWLGRGRLRVGGRCLIATHFPARMRGAVLAAFFASASVGSVLGVMLGGVIATRWGWQAAFGVVGFPGLVLALLYLTVRDYRTVELTPALDEATAINRRSRRPHRQDTSPLTHDAVGLHRRAPRS